MMRWQWLIAVGLLLALLLIAMAFHVNAQPNVQLYEGIALDAGLLHLDKRALDEAYHAQMVKLFGVWLASGAPADATNFRRGMGIARRAYGAAAGQIAEREKQLRP